MTINKITLKLVSIIVIPIFIVLIILGLYNYRNTITIINQYNKSSYNDVYEEIKSFVELQFVALDIIEVPIQKEMENYTQQIIDRYYEFTEGIENVNLHKLRTDLGMNPESYDLYIIDRQGIVVNTTYSEDLGINFFNFGEIHRNFLLTIFAHGKFDSPKFFFESKTKKYKKYSYQATPDGNYIVELGLYSNQADMVFEYMVDHLSTIDQKKNNLSDLDLFFLVDKPIPLQAESHFTKEHLKAIPELIAGSVITLPFVNDEGEKMEYTYLFVKNSTSKLIKGVVIRILNDETEHKKFVATERNKVFWGIIFCILAVSVIVYLVNPIGNVIKELAGISRILATGNIEINISKLLQDRKDELGELARSMSTLISGLLKTAEFARQTGKGNFDIKYNLLSENDILGTSLVRMQEHLSKAKDDELMAQVEDMKNKYVADGLADFSDILRNNNQDVKRLSESLMRKLVDYLKIPMGALFLTYDENNEKYLMPQTTVAYDRVRNVKNKIKFGDELIGRCAYEGKLIYLKEIPQNYFKITSGLGDAKPTYLILVPLIYNHEVLGVIELASFKDIELYKRLLIEKLAESVASTLNAVQINQKTFNLLEQFKKQQEELRAQETEMRQNVEELQATQEEALRRENELLNYVKFINASIFKIEYSTKGDILEMNDRYSIFLKQDDERKVIKNHVDEYNVLSSSYNVIRDIWSELLAGIPANHKTKALIAGNKYVLKEYFWPVKNSHGSVVKIIKLSYMCDS